METAITWSLNAPEPCTKYTISLVRKHLNTETKTDNETDSTSSLALWASVLGKCD